MDYHWAKRGVWVRGDKVPGAARLEITVPTSFSYMGGAGGAGYETVFWVFPGLCEMTCGESSVHGPKFTGVQS